MQCLPCINQRFQQIQQLNFLINHLLQPPSGDFLLQTVLMKFHKNTQFFEVRAHFYGVSLNRLDNFYEGFVLDGFSFFDHFYGCLSFLFGVGLDYSFEVEILVGVFVQC